MAVEQVSEPQPKTDQDAPAAGDLVIFKQALPALKTRLDRDEVMRHLDGAARKGKLAGFERRDPPELFEVEAYSTPFDHVLVASATPDGSGTKLAFRPRLLRKVPLIYAVVIVVSIWPGLPLTHSMLVTYFSWYSGVATWVTAAWYLPLTVLPFLWLIPKWLKRSAKEAAEASREQILKLRDLLDGTLTQG